jgi:hypothetical protein
MLGTVLEDGTEEEEDEGGGGGVAETTTDETTYGKGWKGESWSPSCPESYTGNVAYPDCRGYATCINGIFVGAPVECAYGLSFDAALGLCDFEANVVCGGDEDEDEDYEDGDDVDHYEDYEDESSTEEGGGGGDPLPEMLSVDNDGEDWSSPAGGTTSTPEPTPPPEGPPRAETLQPTPWTTYSPTSSATANAVLFYDSIQAFDGSNEGGRDPSLPGGGTASPSSLATFPVDNDGEEDWPPEGGMTMPRTPEPTTPPSTTPSTSSPIVPFEGDPTRRYCGSSWSNVIDNCL